MKREITNKIRFVLDELVPPILRDSRWFMWPFFVLAYGRISVGEFMEFKSRAYFMSDKEYADFYAGLGNSVSRKRVTDLNEASIKFLIKSILANDYQSLLDVGSGNGYLLERLAQTREWVRVAGVDVVSSIKLKSSFESHSGALPKLPFKNKEFDVVACTHVLEHVIDVAASVQELIRIAKKKIMVVVPRQRYYYYTLDEHLNFYPEIEPLRRLFSNFEVKVSLQGGDWVLIVDLEG